MVKGEIKMHQNLAKTQMYQQKLLKRMLTFLQTLFTGQLMHASINKNEFPSFLKLQNKIPVFKKGSKNSKHYYRPISILKNISKVYKSYV